MPEDMPRCVISLEDRLRIPKFMRKAAYEMELERLLLHSHTGNRYCSYSTKQGEKPVESRKSRQTRVSKTLLTTLSANDRARKHQANGQERRRWQGLPRHPKATAGKRHAVSQAYLVTKDASQPWMEPLASHYFYIVTLVPHMVASTRLSS